ncbi:unnamed protein product [Rhizoctonia solani]|uniref:Zn(2)-C6 fungal-type domain-containing protein n=1 Tax=Rhizoctonia solani TaxID=456999 RepID=A0A8H3B4B8_9AGAM|nr:unnamed protein product [Rhizoctonia solani]
MSSTGTDRTRPIQRSKDGCLTCRKRRKKCDEEWPVCSRCDRTRSGCVWPPACLALGIDSVDNRHRLEAEINDLSFMSTHHLDTHSTLHPASTSFPPFYTTPDPRMTRSLDARMREYAYDLGPRIVCPPVGCLNCDELDPESIAPAFRQSMTAITRTIHMDPVFSTICYFYSTFLTRIFYNYAVPSDTIISWITRKFNASNSAKYGMLCMAGMFLSDYEQSMLARSWRDGVQKVYSLAIEHLSQDLQDARLSPWEKLTGLIPIIEYESKYHSGQFSKYFGRVTKALPLVKAIIGGDTIDLLNLGGEDMFDVNMWAWCDIMDSMATSTPTRLKYESDLERAVQSGTAYQYKGVEWMYGVPNVLAVLLARTSALRHAQLPEQEKVLKGIELELMIRNWHLRPLETKDSRLRVARVGAQEMWRHTAILYVHQAIFKSSCDHPTVKDSVKNIIKLASTLEPGGNPDSFLFLPYFISAFYAVSPKDRYMMRSRLIHCGNAVCLRNLARSLDELWNESDSTGRLTDWAEKKPSRIAF